MACPSHYQTGSLVTLSLSPHCPSGEADWCHFRGAVKSSSTVVLYVSAEKNSVSAKW